MLPRPGYSAAQITTKLDDVIRVAFDYANDIEMYLAWVIRVEQGLREQFVDPPMNRLYTDRLWQLTRTGSGVRRPHDLLREEVVTQVAWLTEISDAVKKMAARFEGFGGTIAVIDTNVLLHHKPLTEIGWAKITGNEKAVRIVVPLAVVDELDAKKAARSEDLARRARTRARLLDGYLDKGGEVRPGVSVEIVAYADLDLDAYRQPPARVDVEVIDVCQALRTYSAGGQVVLVTGDRGMKVRAKEREVECAEGIEAYSQRLGEEAPESTT
jgi:hypothetical protein